MSERGGGGARFIDLVKKVVIGRTEQVFDGWNVITAVAEPFGASQQRVETRVVGSRTHS